ncbi:hypothetical protein [Curtobacterium sp. PhB146]|uniref:hypothetical protein n=1 Tax=Curtobacterium sp. PhB146 TaxID=2485187 RepID=UPI001048A157|nr:hypothetical protein [Curtobacterium sp. PhB146]
MRIFLATAVALWVFLEIVLLATGQNLILIGVFSIFGIFLGIACGYLATSDGMKALGIKGRQKE